MSTRLKMSEFEFDDLDSTFEQAIEGFLAVKVRDLFPDTTLPCSICYPAVRKAEQGARIAVLVAKGGLYKSDVHESLVGEGIEEVYIRKEDETAHYEYFISNLQKILKSSDMPTERKTELLYDNAESIVKKVFRERPSRTNIALGEQLIQNFESHLSTDTVSSHALVSLFSKDYYTFSHCVQVALLGMAFCRFLRWAPNDVTGFGLGALFHDVGKNAIPDEILNKPGKLDADEFEMVKKHPLLGYQQIKNTQKMSKDQLTVVLHHHEARDGSGYPYRLKEESIHKYARVARVADVYDALTTKRPYKDAVPPAEALRIMNDDMRHTFDPKIFDAFMAFLQTEERAGEAHTGHRLNIEMGSEAVVRVGKDGGDPMKATLMGMEVDRYVAFRIKGPAGRLSLPMQGAEITVRYTSAGSVFSFESTVLASNEQPFPVCFLSYPKRIQKIEHRKTPRIECSIPAEIRMGQFEYEGIIEDLSVSGCKLFIRRPQPEITAGLRMDEEVTIHVDFSGKLSTIPGRIRNVRLDQEGGLLGILFIEMSKETREYIDALV